MEIKFPLLTKDDIEIRIGQISKNDPNKASLLLYQDARCGMKYFDKVVGPLNWKKSYYEAKGLLICAISVYNSETKEWVEKADTGSAGSIEEEKSIASDSFKRACVCWGLARELYSAPDIWVNIESKYDKFYVKEIGYNQDQEINKLVIVNAKGDIAYSFPKGAKVSTPKTEETPKQEKPKMNGKIGLEDYMTISNYLMTASDDDIVKFENYLISKYNTKDYRDLGETEGTIVANFIRKKVANG